VIPTDPEEEEPVIPTDPEEEEPTVPTDPENEPTEPEEPEEEEEITGPNFSHAVYDLRLINLASALVSEGNNTKEQVRTAAKKTLTHIMKINGRRIFINPNEVLINGRDIIMRIYTNIFLKIRVKNILKTNGIRAQVNKA